MLPFHIIKNYLLKRRSATSHNLVYLALGYCPPPKFLPSAKTSDMPNSVIRNLLRNIIRLIKLQKEFIMANVNDYATGKVIADMKLGLYLLKFVRIPLIGQFIGNKMLKSIKKYDPQLVNMADVSKLIRDSKRCAVGERVCRMLDKNSEFTEGVFLDELAEAMVKAGKAEYVKKEEAINALEKYPKNPLILSKVEGKYMDLCRTSPSTTCIYWNMQKCGLKCLNI